MIQKQFDFSRKIVLVTGGTSGIGRAAVIAFAKRGATVVFVGRREEEGRRVMQELQSIEKAAHFMKVDLTIEDEVNVMFDEINNKFGRVDIAFNNAGIELEREITDMTYADYRRVFDINVWGVMVAMKHQIGLMLKGGGGAIVNTSSIAGHVGVPGFGAYCASKHAIEGLTKTAALEYSQRGLRINSVAPAFIETPMLDRYVGNSAEARENLISLHPIGRLGNCDDIVNAVLFLCSPSASFIVGESLKVDGGWTAR